jgi:hypothetical protein
MGILRVLSLAVVAAGCGAMAAAQTPMVADPPESGVAANFQRSLPQMFSKPKPVSPIAVQPLMGSPAPLDSRMRVPGLSSREMKRLERPAWPAQGLLMAQNLAAQKLAQEMAQEMAQKRTAQGVKGPCYSIRSYQFERDNAESDAMSFKGYSTCQAVNRPPIVVASPRVKDAVVTSAPR